MSGESTRPASRMGRAARRLQLLEAARAIFVSQGFHASSMDDIAVAAGVSKPVLYQHFPSKVALYRALLESSASTLVTSVRQAISGSEDNAVRVHDAVAAYFSFVADEGQAFRLVFESDLRDEPDIAAIVDDATNACISAISDTITKDTGADKDAARLLAVGLVGISQVGARYWQDQDDPMNQERAVSLLSELAWRGISHFPRQEADRSSHRPAIDDDGESAT